MLLVATWERAATAQNMEVSYGLVAASEVKGDAWDGTASSLVLGTFSLRGGFPIILDDARWVLIPGIVFELIGVHSTVWNDRAIYGLGGSFVVFHRPWKRWGLVAQVGLTHRSDLEGNSEQAWGVNATLMAQWFIRKGHRLGFGAALSYQQARLLPLLS